MSGCALNGHHRRADGCSLSRVKQTSLELVSMSANEANSDMSHPGASHKSNSMADQSTMSEKAARHVMLVIFFLISIRTHLKISSYRRISSHRQGRVNHEDRRDRRHRPARIEDPRPPAPAPPR